MPTDAGFKFELVSEEFKPHIHITVNNNNLPPAANVGHNKQAALSNILNVSRVPRGSNVTLHPSITNTPLLPLVNAGTNQTVNENSTVTLVGLVYGSKPIC